LIFSVIGGGTEWNSEERCRVNGVRIVGLGDQIMET